MQFIDQVEVADASLRQGIPEANLTAHVQKFANMAMATTYTDADYLEISQTAFNTYQDLWNEITFQGPSFEGKGYRNKVYKTAGMNIDDQPRLLLGDWMEGTNVDLRVNTEGKKNFFNFFLGWGCGWKT
jgi:hypothetical protein